MRTAIVISLALVTVACGSSDDDKSTTGPGSGLGTGQWELGPKSGVCVSANGAAGMFIDSPSGANCMAQGSIEQGEDGKLAFIPKGDKNCRIPIQDKGQSIVLGDGGQACAYYCGGDATYAGRELTKIWQPKRAIEDVAGDPIC